MAVHQSTSDPQTGRGARTRAIEDTYRRYRTELRVFFARRAQRTESVEDLVQEVYERLLRYRSETPVEDPLGYLFKTAWNVLHSANQRERRERHTFVASDAAGLESLAGGFRRLWVDDSGEALAQEEIERMLNRLPRACKIALIRQRRDGYSYQQIAEELQVSVNTVKDYIVKALNHCRLHLSMSCEDR